MRLPSALPFLLLLASALAGCSGGDGGDAEGPGAAPSATSASAAPPPPPLPTSDTLHLLAAPEMAPALPEGGGEAATPVTVSGFDGGGGQGPVGAEWRHAVERAANVTGGEVRIWVEVKETMLHTPDNQVRPTCTWSLTLSIGADNNDVNACVQEPPGPISPGTKELVFPITLPSPVDLEANETITVRLERSGFSLSANNAVDALSGSAEHDSHVRLTGLKEPIRR